MQKKFFFCLLMVLPGLILTQTFRSPFDLEFSPDGALLAVSDRTADRVYLIDVEDGSLKKEIKTKDQPLGLAWENPTSIVFAEYGEAKLARINTKKGKVKKRFNVSPKPVGVSVSSKNQTAVVTEFGLGEVCLVDLKSNQLKSRISVKRQPYFSAITPDEKLALIGHLIPGDAATDAFVGSTISLIDMETQKNAGEILLPYGSSNVRKIVVSPDGRWAYVAHTRGKVNLPTSQLERGWVNTNALSIIDLNEETLYATLLLDYVQRGAADPWGVAISPDGHSLYVTLAGVHEIAHIDLKRMHAMLAGDLSGVDLLPSDAKARIAHSVWHEIKKDPAARQQLENELSALYAADLLERYSLGVYGPRGLAVSPDGKMLAVGGYFSGRVLLIDANNMKVMKDISLGKQSKESVIRMGERFFHDGKHSFQHWLSCATCHPDGRADGMNWDLLNDGIGNPKNTKSLVYSHKTPPSMSTGVREDFETAVRAGFTHIQFIVADDSVVTSVEKYIGSLEPESSPYLSRKGKMSKEAKYGKELFQNAGCSNCHPSPLYTDLSKHNVGTRYKLDRTGTFDNPTLLELWRTGPYLHSGAAGDLETMMKKLNIDDQHGSTSDLSQKDIEALIAYLKSL